MYSDVVLGIEHQQLRGHPRATTRTRAGYTLDTELDRRRLGRRWSRATRSASRRSRASRSRRTRTTQLWGAIGAVFGSWMNAARHHLSPPARHPGKLGHRRQRAGHGVRQHGRHLGHRRRLHPQSVDRREAALRRVPDQRPGRGRRRRHPHAAGDHRRARARRPAPTSRRWKRRCRRRSRSSTRIYGVLEKHYRDMQDIEFTVEQGKLWMLQTRNGKRTAKAALRIAVELANEKLITQGRGGDADRAGLARPAAAPDHRSEGRAQGDRDRPAGVAGRGLRRDRVLRPTRPSRSRPRARR